MSTKLIAGIIIGAGAALAIGYLMTDEGSEIRKKIKKGGGGIFNSLCDILNQGKEIVTEYSDDVAEDIREGVSGAAEKAARNI